MHAHLSQVHVRQEVCLKHRKIRRENDLRV